MSRVKEILAWLAVPLAPLLVGLAVETPVLVAADRRFLALVALVGIAVLGVWLGGTLIVRRSAGADFSFWSALRLSFPSALLTMGAAAYLTLIEERGVRLALLLLLLLLLWAFVQNLRFAVADPAGERARNLNNLACAVDAVGGFLILAFLFGINDFLTVPVAVGVALVGVTGGWIAYETLRRYGFELRTNVAVVVFFALYAAELQAALSFLPTAREVGAVVAVIAFALPLHLSLQALSGRLNERRAYRLAGLSVATVVLLLLTANWR